MPLYSNNGIIYLMRLVMKKLFLLSIVFVFVFTACQSNQPLQTVAEPSETAVEILMTATSTATLIPPTATVELPTVTAFPSVTSTQTMTPTPVVKFEDSEIFGIENRGNYISIILKFPGVKKPYDVKLNGNQYNCKMIDGISDRLYCSGPILKLESYTTVKYFPNDGSWNNSLYEGEIWVPKPYTTPMPAGDPRTWCPLRGTDVFCETEHRVENGEECWVMSCFDACGYYYSYHTCQEDPHDNFLAP
jgi:hypothetical protein